MDPTKLDAFCKNLDVIFYFLIRGLHSRTVSHLRYAFQDTTHLPWSEKNQLTANDHQDSSNRKIIHRVSNFYVWTENGPYGRIQDLHTLLCTWYHPTQHSDGARRRNNARECDASTYMELYRVRRWDDQIMMQSIIGCISQ